MAAEIHVADVGVAFRLTVRDQAGVAVDLSENETLTVKFQLPNKTVLTTEGTLYTDGTDGVVEYTTIAGDLSLAGRWKVQAIVDIPDGEFHSNVHKFRVFANL